MFKIFPFDLNFFDVPKIDFFKWFNGYYRDFLFTLNNFEYCEV